MYVCPVRALYSGKSKEGGRSLRTGAMDGCEPPGRFWKPNSGGSSAKSTTAANWLLSRLQLLYSFPSAPQCSHAHASTHPNNQVSRFRAWLKKCLLGELPISKPNNLSSFNSPGSTRQKRTNSRKLSSDLHMSHGTRVRTHTHKYTK